MPQILDAAIGTIFVFLLFSFVVTAANELILSTLDSRADFFQLGLNELLKMPANTPNGGSTGRLLIKVISNDWVKKLCDHGLINAYSKGDGGNRPSYLPGGAFVTCLIDLLRTGALKSANNTYTSPTAGTPLDINQILTAINALPACPLKDSLHSLISTTGRDLEAFKAAVEGWYNGAMNRVTGWYKRFAQKWMILIGFVLAAALNVDSIHIVQVLANNPNLAKAVASQAATFVEKQPAPVAPVAGGGSAPATPNPEDARKAFQAKVDALSATGIPIGWDEAQLASLGLKSEELTFKNLVAHYGEIFPWLWAHRGQLFLLIVGWLLTALAGSLGAPFWFDLLSRFVNIRNAGKPPGDKDPTQPDNVPKAPPDLLRTPITRQPNTPLTSATAPALP